MCIFLACLPSTYNCSVPIVVSPSIPVQILTNETILLEVTPLTMYQWGVIPSLTRQLMNLAGNSWQELDWHHGLFCWCFCFQELVVELSKMSVSCFTNHLKYKMYGKRQLPLSDLMERMVTCMEGYFKRQEGQVQGWFGVQAWNIVFGISSSSLWTLALSKNTTSTLLLLIAKFKRQYVVAVQGPIVWLHI